MTKKRARGRARPARRPATRRSPARRGTTQARRRAALQGWKTRRTKAKAKAAAAAARVKASRHGQKARKATDRKLTPAQLERRRKDARRVTQRIRRAKKAGDAAASASRLRRSRSSRSSRDRSKRSTLKPPPSTSQEAVHIGRGDKFAAQIGVRFDMPAGFVPTPELVREAIRYRLENGVDAPRTHTKILRWRNPGRRRAEDRAWRQGNQGDAWNTLATVIAAALEGALEDDYEPDDDQDDDDQDDDAEQLEAEP